MDGFLSQRPDIVRRKAQPLQKARVQCSTREAFVNFFDKIKNLYTSWCMNGPKEAAYFSSDNGWPDKNNFFFYFKKFVDWSKDWPKQILVLYNGHVSQLALENNIYTLSLFRQTQALSPVKKEWVKIKREN